MKPCSKCGEVKPLDEFHRNKKHRDGREARCKRCRQAQMSAYSARPETKARKAEYGAEYNAANPHIYWENQYRLRAKKYGHPAVIEPFTKDELIAKYGDKCAHCGGPFEELDHYVVPVALGGHHTLDNCRPSCAPCNAKGRGIRRTNPKK